MVLELDIMHIKKMNQTQSPNNSSLSVHLQPCVNSLSLTIALGYNGSKLYLAMNSGQLSKRQSLQFMMRLTDMMPGERMLHPLG